MNLRLTRAEDLAALLALGAEYRVHLEAANTGGAIGIFEERNVPGGGPPLHVHRDADETFEIEEGRYRFRCGDADAEAGPGAVIFIPRGTPHTFLNVGDGPGRFRCIMTPGGFEGFFAEIARRGLDLPADLEAIIAVGRDFSVEFVGPNPFLPAA